MGVLKQGILGGFSGKVANIIGTSWKGIAVIKAMPLSVANPMTAGQVAQRALFKNCSLFGVVILAVIIKPLWDRFSIRMSGFNSFVRDNIDLFAAELPIPASGMIISKGKMAATAIGTTVCNAPSAVLVIPWADDEGEGYKLATDIPFFVLTNSETKEILASDGVTLGVTRTDNTVDFPLGKASVFEQHWNVYLAFRRADGTVVSNTDHKEHEVG